MAPDGNHHDLQSRVFSEEISGEAGDLPQANPIDRAPGTGPEAPGLSNAVDGIVSSMTKKFPLDLKRAIELIEKQIIFKILCEVQGDRHLAAQKLKMRYSTLYQKTHKYKIRIGKIVDVGERQGSPLNDRMADV